MLLPLLRRLQIALATCVLLLPSLAHAQTLIDFESDLVLDGFFVTGISSVPEITLSGARIVIPGSPTEAFNGNSTGMGAGGIDDANSGNSISAVDGLGSIVTVSFSRPISNLTFAAIDIDTTSTFMESLTARVYDSSSGGNLLFTFVIEPGDPGTGDGTLAPVDLSSGFIGADAIQRLEFNGVNASLSTAGYAIDNLSFDFTPAPVPASDLLGHTLLIVASLALGVFMTVRSRMSRSSLGARLG